MIRYLPTKILKKIAPEKLVKKLVKGNLTLNRTALTMVTKADFLTKKTMENVALKVLKTYKEKYRAERADGVSKTLAIEETVNDKKLMVNRVQNSVIFEVHNEIKDQFLGEFYEWLPSDAEIPDPLHQLNYGETFQVGVGEMPGDRYGCRCGMNILVSENKLEL